MKIIRLGLAALLFAGMAQAGEEIQIISYFPDKGTVCVDQGAGKTNRPFCSFTDAEQKKITGWLADREFENSGLSVTIEEKKTTKENKSPNDSKGGRCSGEVNYISYVITLENRAKVSFKDVSVNARIFYETYEKQARAKTVNILKESSETISLSPGETRTVKTKAVPIRDQKIVYEGQIMESSGVTVSGPSGLMTVGGGDTLVGPPTRYMRDRLKGLYLCVSKQDLNGKTTIHEFENGNPPEKENWADYQQQGKSNLTEKVSTAKGEISDDVGTWSEEDLRSHIQKGKHGIYTSALLVAEYYYKQGDQEKTKEWADKVRKLVKQTPKEHREEKAKIVAARLAVLDQMEEMSTSR